MTGKKSKRVKESIFRNNWLASVDRVAFLASGEYNENYIVYSGDNTYVFRINHGSQLRLTNQMEYEFNVLRAVQTSGVTPQPLFFNADDDIFHTGILLMTYCEGRRFSYSLHKEKAAFIFARIHSLPLPDTLILQENPITDIAEESAYLIHRYSDHPLVQEKKRLLAYYSEIQRLGDESASLYNNEHLCIVNTEVNSGNFIVNDHCAYLVDWEKAVVSYRHQDLGHFLVPTTTLWKSDYVYSPDEKREFLIAYKRFLNLNMDIDELIMKTNIMEKVILLRALSWCYMAYYEYTMSDRDLKNNDTFIKIKSYLKDIDWFLK